MVTSSRFRRDESPNSRNKSDTEKKRLSSGAERNEQHQHGQGPRSNGGRSTPESLVTRL